MTTKTLSAGSDAHVLSSQPAAELGGPAALAVDSGQAIAFVQFPLGTRIPANATVSEARLRIYQKDAWSGSATLTAQRVGQWKAGQVNWNNQPATLGTAVPVTQSDTADKALWTFVVTADVQAWLAGAANYGWRITSSSTARRYIRGFDAATFKPVLEIDYTVPPDAPTDLVPSFGAVSVTKPVLSFTAAGITSLQVQIDPTGAFTSPTFDSGTVAATEGLYDLSTSTYGGLASGSTMWRARVTNAGGTSAWSQTATFSRVAFPALTITSPGATSSDATPLVAWTFTGQTQRRVITRDAAGVVLDDSGWATTTSQSYLPAKGVTKSGQAASVEVQVRDAVVREATQGAPDYAAATQSYTFTFSATPVAVTSLTVTQPTVAPWVLLTWDRVEVPDGGWVIVRDGAIVAAIEDPLDATVGDHYEWTDYTADPNRAHTWFVAPKVNGLTGSAGPTATFTITTLPLWIVDPETGDQVCIWGDDEGDWDTPQEAALYAPINAEYVIRRVTSRRKPEGALTGVLADVPGYPTALACEALLEEWADNDTGTYRVVAGPRNIKVTLGDINLRPTTLDRAGDPVIGVSWSFWSAP